MTRSELLQGKPVGKTVKGDQQMLNSPSTPAASSSSKTPRSSSGKMGNTPSSPSKLRRTVPVDPIKELNSVQRLVEYFIVVSSQPRWENARPVQSPPATPERVKRSVSTPAVVDAEIPKTTPFQKRAKKFNSSLNFLRRKETTSGSANAINNSHSIDTQETESREEVMPAPKPRGKWTREDSQGTEGNIHIPDANGYEHSFQPKVTARFPLNDYEDNPLNPMVTQFCFPAGDVIVPSKVFQLPRVHHFVLTNDKGRKIYGTCLTIYEEYKPLEDDPWQNQDLVHGDSGENDIEVTVESQNSTLYLPKCLCILSFWPYVTAFREYLAQLYRLATSTNVMTAPIERYVMNLCMEIPAPPPGAFEVQVSILDSIIRFWAPPAKLPIAYVALPYQTLFDCLDVENVIHLWYCLAMERKILLISSQYSILTVCAEILCSLLFPMQWSHLYVPLLPRFLCPILDAPVPYLCGVTRENWLHAQQFVNEETIVVDLDRNSVLFGEATPELPPVPEKKWTKLQRSLDEIAGNLFWRTRGLEDEYRQFSSNRLSQRNFKKIGRQKGDHLWNEKLETFDHAFNLQFTPDSENLVNSEAVEREQSQWDSLQEAFLRFFVSVFKDYRKFLHTPDADTPASPTLGSSDWLRWSKRRSFNWKGFVASQKPEYSTYLTELCMTQQFDDFITKRLYTPELPDIIFFDQSIDAKLNRSRLRLKKVDTPFLQSAKTHKILKTLQAVEPNAADLPADYDFDAKKPAMHESWPETFDPRLFCKPRPIPSMITAEFDRQAALVTRLRANHTPSKKGSEDFYGTDFDVSPEAMAFTVFFFAYSAVIGREWKKYQEKRRELQVASPYIHDRDPNTQEEREDVVPDGQKLALESVQLADINLESVQSVQNAMADLSLGVCESLCPNASVSNAVIHVSNQMVVSPQSYLIELNVQAQVAYETILSQMAQSTFGDFQQQRETSLLDNDETFAEYEEAREVAAAQLDLAFDTLKAMEMRGLMTDPDLFKSLMEACGRCGNTKRALELIEMMKRDGLVADREVLSCFMTAFARDAGGSVGGTPAKDDFLKTDRRGSDAYSTFLRKKLNAMGGDSPTSATVLTGPLSSSDDEDCSGSDFMSDSGASDSSRLYDVKEKKLGIFEWLTPLKKPKPKKKRRKRRRNGATDKPVSDRLMKQIVLGESLLQFLYPDLSIDTSGDTCPQCSKVMTEANIIAGWQPCEFEDFTTSCPNCKHRFVPRFSVSCSSPTFEGNQGKGTPLYCEFLSPWVLRKELNHIIGCEVGIDGIDMMLDPDWRSGTDIRATLWWNLIAMCNRYGLPFPFLLQGSFQNRLINPVPAD
jgi:pentatricopeptide repeat protein